MDFDTWFFEVYENMDEEDKSANDDYIALYHEYLFDTADKAFGRD